MVDQFELEDPLMYIRPRVYLACGITTADVGGLGGKLLRIAENLFQSFAFRFIIPLSTQCVGHHIIRTRLPQLTT